MWGKLVAIWLMGTVFAVAQGTLSYDQVKDILQSSVKQGLRDKEVANYLKNQKLNFALSDALIEEFVGWGIGPRTLNVLREMKPETQGLPAPKITKSKEPAAKQPPPPPPDEQERIIEEARQNALEYTDRLPDFVCLQVTRRYMDPTGLEMDWLKYDEIKTRVSYFDDHENYEVIAVNNKVVGDRAMHELGGATSTGEFGSMLAELFDPKTQTKFRWARHSLLRGHPVYVFHYNVSRNRSRWRITYEHTDEIITAYRGLVYIDKETERVLRIVMSTYDIPPSFPIQEARTRLDYDYTDISGRDFLLPLKAQVRMRQGKRLTRNDVEFRLYRKFSAEATLTFDEIDDLEPLPEDEPDEEQE